MNTLRFVVAALWLTATAASLADISRLFWLAGCWTLDGQETGSIEQWTAPAGKSMIGINRLVRQGQTESFEFMRIIEGGAGQLVLVATPSGQETARFNLTSISSTEVIFENSQHDFPRKISYRLLDDNKLIARIEGFINGNARSADFPMTRNDCASALKSP